MAVQLNKLTEKQFSMFAELVYQQAGIYLPPEKRTLLSNRLRVRLRALGLDDFEAYYQRLATAAFADEELPHFLSAVTTNETYFFRNKRLWDIFETRLIPAFVSRSGGRSRSIRVWSAAASSGEEAYSAAIALRENLPDFATCKPVVIASDISAKVLDLAQKGFYREYAVAQMPPSRRRRWFTEQDGGFQLKEEIRSLVRFTFHNLRDPFPMSGFDLVLLRNVLMYFDTPMKLRAIDTAARAVAPGGYLFVGDVDPIRTSPPLAKAMALIPEEPGFYYKPAVPAAYARQEGGAV